MEEKIVYFETAGKQNTAETLRLAKERAAARGINKIILASTRGDTAREAAAFFAGSDIRLIVVPHQFSFTSRTAVTEGQPPPGTQRFPRELVADLEAKGHRVHFGTMLFHTNEFYGNSTPRLMANLLRIFCQGIKVVVEMIYMVCDAGLVEPGEKVIAVAGRAAGADTAVVASAGPTTRPNELHIQEIICKPL